MPRAPKFFHFFLPAILLTSVIVLAACGSSSSKSKSDAKIRFVNASIDSTITSVDVWIDGTKVATALANGGTATAYLSVASGARRIQVQDPATLLFLTDTTPTLSAGNTTYIFKDYIQRNNTNTPLILTDDNSAPATGSFKLRAVNVAPNQNANVDVYIQPAGTDINTVAASASGIIFPGASSYLVNTAGTDEVLFTQAGTKGLAGGPPVGASSVVYAAGQVRTVLLLENITGNYSTVDLKDVN